MYASASDDHSHIESWDFYDNYKRGYGSMVE